MFTLKNIILKGLIALGLIFFVSIWTTPLAAESNLNQNKNDFPINNEQGLELTEPPTLEVESFRAVVKEVISESTEEGSYFQDLRLEGKTGSYKNKEIIYLGDTENISSNLSYEEGNTLFLTATKIDDSDEALFLITDKSRLPAIYFITILFAAIVLIIGRGHGLRALLSLAATFVVIIGFVVPRILDGADPVRLVVSSSVVIVVASMVIVYGWTTKSKIAISGMLIGVLITAIISKLFTDFAALTGTAFEEVMFLREFLGTDINFQGLLLASFILGSLGILDDIAITQTSTAQEISGTDKNLKPVELYKKSMRIGVDHIASMINTLFLAYAGASFVLLLLFGLNQAPFSSFSDVINNELVATEIVRTLVGSIGLILTVPITTYIAAQVYGKKEKSS